MENFIVSARKYRPGTFDSVVGQLPITSTLKNAIKSGQIAQAFLFCGPRGVGKTTCARILAKTINCSQILPDGEACNICQSCESFNRGTSFNIHELDAASNNSVDDIRALIDQVRIPPQTGKYKIYIIDEVHMLSQQAFNAFLKTLEEPPSYAKFILATTEKHKIIPTVLSRCQIFDFKRISADDIVKRLIFVANIESVTFEADALHIIAQKSDGALRDALSMFDQLVSSGNKNLTYRHVIGNLNVLDYDYYFRITQQILENRMAEAMLMFDEIISNGFDGQHFIVGMAEHLRNLLVSKDEATIQLLEASDVVKQRYRQQSSICNAPFLLQVIDIANKCDLDYRLSNHKRLLVELAILKMGAQLHSIEISSSNLTKQTVATKSGTVADNLSGSPLPAEKNITPQLVQEPADSYKPETKQKPVIEPQTHKSKQEPNPELKTEPQHKTYTIRISDNESKEEDKENSQQNSGEIYKAHEPITEPLRKFDHEELIRAWMDFASQVAEPIPNLYATLTQSVPEIQDYQSFKINYKVHSKVQEREFADHKAELLAFLRSHFGNHKITITTQIEEPQTAETPYLPNDKFNKMAEKNPALIKMREKLNLELDF